MRLSSSKTLIKTTKVYVMQHCLATGEAKLLLACPASLQPQRRKEFNILQLHRHHQVQKMWVGKVIWKAALYSVWSVQKVTHPSPFSSWLPTMSHLKVQKAQFGLHHHHHPSCMTISQKEKLLGYGTSCFHCSTTFILQFQTRRQAQKVVCIWIKQICIWISRDVSLA